MSCWGRKSPPSFRKDFAERLDRGYHPQRGDALAQQIGTGIELSALRKDGSEFPIEIMLSPLESKEGILVTAIRDIRCAQGCGTAPGTRWRANTAGYWRRRPMPWWWWIKNGKMVLLNFQAEKTFGYHRDELVGQQVTVLIPRGFCGTVDRRRDPHTAAEAARAAVGTGIELLGRCERQEVSDRDHAEPAGARKESW